MTQSPSSSDSSPNLALRWAAPAWMSMSAAALLLLASALLLFTWAASDFRGLDAVSASVLIWPASIGTGLAALSLRRGVQRRGQAVWRAGAAMGAAGFAWPLSFGIAALPAGDTATALAALAPAVAGLVLGAFSGSLAGALAAHVFLTSSPPRPPR